MLTELQMKALQAIDCAGADRKDAVARCGHDIRLVRKPGETDAELAARVAKREAHDCDKCTRERRRRDWLSHKPIGQIPRGTVVTLRFHGNRLEASSDGRIVSCKSAQGAAEMMVELLEGKSAKIEAVE